MRIGETIEAPNMGMRLTCRESTPALKFDLWMRGDAAPIPMHVHPHQQERITVVRGCVRSRTGKADRMLKPGDVVVTPAGEAHTVGPGLRQRNPTRQSSLFAACRLPFNVRS